MISRALFHQCVFSVQVGRFIWALTACDFRLVKNGPHTVLRFGGHGTREGGVEEAGGGGGWGDHIGCPGEGSGVRDHTCRNETDVDW